MVGLKELLGRANTFVPLANVRVAVLDTDTTFIRLLQPLNAEAPILLTFARFIYVRPVHALNALAETVTILFVKCTFVRDVTPLNIAGGIELESIKILLQPVNALTPTLVIVFGFGIVIEFNDVQSLKAVEPIPVILAPPVIIRVVRDVTPENID